MTISYTEEMKFPQSESGGYNWGAILNGVLEALDSGQELTFTFGEDVDAGECVAINSTDGRIYKADAKSATLTPAIGFAPNDVTSGNDGKVRYFGYVDVDTAFSAGASISWSAGEAVYPDSVAGRICKTQYSWANPVGYAKGATDSSWNTRVVVQPNAWDGALNQWLQNPTFASVMVCDSAGDNCFSYDPDTSIAIILGQKATLSQMPRIHFGFNGDNDPAIGFLVYDHDNIAIAFDAYSNGSNWISSDAGSNFAIYKTGDELRIGYASGNTKGSIFAGFGLSAGVRFSVDGRLGVGVAPSEKIHTDGTIRTDDVFNVGGVDGGSGTVTWNDGDANAHEVTIVGGIITSWLKATVEQLT